MAGPLLTSEGKLKDTVDPAAADAHKGHTPDDRVAVAFLRRYTTRMGRAQRQKVRVKTRGGTVSHSIRVGRGTMQAIWVYSQARA